MALSTRRWSSAGAFLIFAALALFLLRDGLRPGSVMISGEALQHALPWAAVLPPQEPHNRFLGDQSRLYYPYLLQAAEVYAGRADPVWSSAGGGGQPFLGNMSSSLLHPLTLLAAVFATPLVPLLQGLLVLALSAQFTFLFLRRLNLGWWAALCGGLAFGFGGHQVLWLQYALSHTLLGLPFCFWAVERLVEDRSRRRVAVLAGGFALLVFGGHPETALVAGAVAGLWALWRLWDAHGRFLVAGAVVLGVLLAAVQWMPFVEYALASHGLVLRARAAEQAVSGVTLGAALVFALFLLAALALLRGCAESGLLKMAAATVAGVVVLIMARRMGMAVSSGVMVLPGMYGSPLGGGEFTGAQDYPGLNSGYVGVLPALLLALGAVVGLGGGFVRFFAGVGLALWGTAFHLPGAESAVRLLPGFQHVEPTRLLGPVAFLTACGGAMVLDILSQAIVKPRVLAAVRRVALVLALILVGTFALLKVPPDPNFGRTVVPGLISPRPGDVTQGRMPVPISFDVAVPADDLHVIVDGRLLRTGRAAATAPGAPMVVLYDAQRGEEGPHWVRVEVVRDGRTSVIADQPLAIWRQRKFAPRDVTAVVLALALLVACVTRRRAWAPAAAALVIGLDVLSFGNGYNAACPAERLYPPTRTVEFLKAQPQPFRIFTEGNILPPDTQCAAGLEHILSYDNLGYHRLFQWLIAVPVDMDAYATYSFSRANVAYATPRFSALDVRYIVTAPDEDLSDIPGMRLVHESETRVWENLGNAGRAFVVGQAMNVNADDPELLARADPRETALLETTFERSLGGHGTARVTENRGSHVAVSTECEGDVLLVLAECRGPGWLASVDGGAEQPTLPCDVAWQAIPLGSGHHDVVFRLDSGALRWGLRLSIAAAVVALLMLLLPRQLS